MVYSFNGTPTRSALFGIKNMAPQQTEPTSLPPAVVNPYPSGVGFGYGLGLPELPVIVEGQQINTPTTTPPTTDIPLEETPPATEEQQGTPVLTDEAIEYMISQDIDWVTIQMALTAQEKRPWFYNSPYMTYVPVEWGPPIGGGGTNTNTLSTRFGLTNFRLSPGG
jgi:hypothetical protein